jgi:hypothetical protein
MERSMGLLSNSIGPSSQRGIGHKPLRLETEALFCPLAHGSRRADLGLANGEASTSNGDTELHVHEIVDGVSKECRALVTTVHCAAGSIGETNFGTTSLAAPRDGMKNSRS